VSNRNPVLKGLFSMSEVNDISRRRLADFFAARVKANHVENNETQQTRPESRPAPSQRTEEKRAPTSE
jgi:hypothetical protein